MIEDDFYATIKFKSGEEIFAKVAASEEINRTVLLVSNPIIVNEVQGKKGMLGYRIEPWFCLLYTSPSPRDVSTSRMPSSA